MGKRIFTLIFTLLCILPSQAVLKEKDLEQTISVLLSELKQFKELQINNSNTFEERYKQMEKQMRLIMQRADQTSLMLYSQQSDYIFDLTYACHEATQQYQNFHTNLTPFSTWVTRLNIEVERYTALINSLNNMPDFLLNEEHLGERDSCLLLSTQIRAQLIKNRNNITRLQERHDQVEQRLKELNDYAQARYDNIRTNIFVNGGDSYYSILKQIKQRYRRALNAIERKYNPINGAQSDWRSSTIVFCFIFVILWMSIASAISVVIINWLVPKSKQDKNYKERKPCMIWTLTIVTFAIAVMILRTILRQHGFFQMATELLIQYAWLLGVILISLLIRLWNHPERIKRGIRIYSPIFLLSFVVIAFRIIFIPNETVNLVFPPILIFCLIWQFVTIYMYNNTTEGKISESDYFYAYISMLVITICTICAWQGYTLLSVQILIWWYIQLACIQTITCIYTLLHLYQDWRLKRYKEKLANKEIDKKTIIVTKDDKGNESYKLDITKTWFYDFVYMALIPILAVYSVMFSIYWAATVFSMNQLVVEIFKKYYIDVENTFRLSLFTLSLIIAMFFIVKYGLYLGRELYLRRHRLKNGEKNVVALGLNIVTIFVWGLYLIISLKILNVGTAGILAVLAGMSTGIGLALKDLIENLFYGVSLMTGRVKVGDYIELDGIRGKVNNINYQSTMVETLDGSIIAFQNSQLFSKNFKNLTKNHGNEMVKIPIGVAYGTNVEKVRDILRENMKELDCWNQKRGLEILFDNFGENSVDLILVCWVPVSKKLTAVSQMKEVVYKTFNDNGIEIPFPQRDVYVRQMTAEKIKSPITDK